MSTSDVNEFIGSSKYTLFFHFELVAKVFKILSALSYTLMPGGQSETIKGLVIGKNYYHDFNRSGFKVQPNRGSENVRFDRKIDFSLSESLDSGSGFMQILPHLFVNTVYPRYFSVTAGEEEG